MCIFRSAPKNELEHNELRVAVYSTVFYDYFGRLRAPTSSRPPILSFSQAIAATHILRREKRDKKKYNIMGKSFPLAVLECTSVLFAPEIFTPGKERKNSLQISIL